jgi:hypothetical protein
MEQDIIFAPLQFRNLTVKNRMIREIMTVYEPSGFEPYATPQRPAPAPPPPSKE